MSRFAVLLAIAPAISGCSREDDGGEGPGFVDALPPGTPTCTPPPQLTYDCQPVPLGTPNSCAQGPTFYEFETKPDPDKAFPFGCKAEFPHCLYAYPNVVATCWCNDFEGAPGAPTWYCPL